MTVLGPPTAVFACGSCSAPENQAVAFDAGSSSGSGALSYAWTFGDGASGSGAMVTHSYANNGFYITALTIQDIIGLTRTTTHPVIITNLAPAIQAMANAGPATPGQPVTITVTASDVPSDTLAYAFDCDDNAIFEIGPQAGHQAACQFGASGAFTVTVNVSDGDGDSAQGRTVVAVAAPDHSSFSRVFLPIVVK